MKVLLSAYACDPDNGSEPGVGWQMLRSALAICDEVVLLTRENNTERIRAALSPQELARLEIAGFDLSPSWRKAKRVLPSGVQAYYLRWQLAARRLAEELAHSLRVDVAHHATFAVDWMPTALDRLCHTVPVVWGPVGGASYTPRALLPSLGVAGITGETVRWVSNSVSRWALGRRMSTGYALCVAQNDDVMARLNRRTQKVVCEPNAFVDLSALPVRDPRNVDENLLVGVGRLVPWKGWAYAIRSLQYLPPEVRLELYGEGSDQRRLERIARSCGVADRVRFAGYLPREDTLDALSRARAMLFPSLHDAAATAIGEALSIGCPVLALPLGGSRVMLRRPGGVPVPLTGNIPQALAQSLTSLYTPKTSVWSADRLDGLLAQWYEQAIGTPVVELAGSR